MALSEKPSRQFGAVTLSIACRIAADRIAMWANPSDDDIRAALTIAFKIINAADEALPKSADQNSELDEIRGP